MNRKIDAGAGTGAAGWCVLDTETTGLGGDREPVEVAVIGSAGQPVFDSPIRPRHPPHRDALRIHGLSWEDLQGAPTFGEVLPALSAALARRRVFCYGAPFDRRTLELACRRAGRPLPPCHWECILDRYEATRSFRPSLRTACEIEGIPIPPGPHRARTDALLAWQLLRKLTLIDNFID